MKINKVQLPFKIKKPVLALGSQAKNTVCFAEGDTAYISSLHKDLSNPADLFDFEKDVRHFLKKKPKIIACDLHPEYESTKYAYELLAKGYLPAGQAGQLRTVQHHHAHIASCMAQNGLKNQKIIGVAFDGTGLGVDNTLWGGEFLVSDYAGFKRVAHLKEIPLLGGEKAVLEPLRLAAAWLYSIYKDDVWKLKLDLLKKVSRQEWLVWKKMYSSGLNSPLSSSMGRLFDAVGSLVLGRTKVNFEAELAIGMEKIASRCNSGTKSYKFDIVKEKNGYIIDPAPLFKQIILDIKKKQPQGQIAHRFHLSAAGMILKVCLALRRENGINKVILSGGVFQNNLLLCRALDLLYKEDFKVFTAGKTASCNDSGVSLGQAVVANARS
jgi:hydrogenase maturation protein HypF